MPTSSVGPRQLALLSSLFALLALAGCGMGTVSTVTSGSLTMSGRVHGGLQPVTGAAIQLFAVGTGGNGSAATSLLVNPVVTGSNSYFSLTGDYTCPSASAQVYLVARGGNPGLAAGTNNRALTLMAALGSCGSLIANPNRFIQLNEVTTVGAVYALAPFLTAYDHVGASSTNTIGIANAFLDAGLLADTSTGMAATLPSTLAAESSKLYALADAIVPCVNSNGGAACTQLFAAATPSGGTAPTDTVAALLDVVRNPGHNVSQIFNLVGSTPPYPTTLTAAPHDWTMSLSVTGGGLQEPTQLAIDHAGNVWVANYGSPGPAGLIAYSPQGTPFAGSPFGVGLQTEAYGLALDRNGDIWVTSRENYSNGTATGSVAKFLGAGSASPGALVHQYQDSTIQFPTAVATDPTGSGTVLVVNYNHSSLTYYDLNGNFLRNRGSGDLSYPVGATADGTGGVWVSNSDNYISHILSNGTIQDVTCCYVAQSVSLDPGGNVWVTNYNGIYTGVNQPPRYTFSEITPAGSVAIYEASGGGLTVPGGGFVDAGGQFWVANYTNPGSLSEIAGNYTGVTAGTALSPSTGLGADANLAGPFAIAPDPSGNLWVSSRFNNKIVMFFGMATPTATPAVPRPQNP